MPDYDLPREVEMARRMVGQAPEGFTDLQALVYGQADPGIVGDALTVSAYKNTLDAKDADGMTALMYAAKDLKGDIAERLVRAGANKALTNNEGKTALALFDEAMAADQAIAEENGESPTVDPNVAEDIRKTFEGGRRRRKTRARQPRQPRKTRRRQTRRRR